MQRFRSATYCSDGGTPPSGPAVTGKDVVGPTDHVLPGNCWSREARGSSSCLPPRLGGAASEPDRRALDRTEIMPNRRAGADARDSTTSTSRKPEVSTKLSCPKIRVLKII